MKKHVLCRKHEYPDRAKFKRTWHSPHAAAHCERYEPPCNLSSRACLGRDLRRAIKERDGFMVEMYMEDETLRFLGSDRRWQPCASAALTKREAHEWKSSGYRFRVSRYRRVPRG